MWDNIVSHAGSRTAATELLCMSLLYGDYPDLSRRCLDSWQWLPDAHRVVLCNAVCTATLAYVRELVFARRIDAAYISRENNPKYQYMRAVLQDLRAVDRFRYLMWFDDDSYLCGDLQAEWPRLQALFRDEQVAMLGAAYRQRCPTRQQRWVARQPWYNPDQGTTDNVQFLTGGWWIARLQFFKEIDYPWPELQHNGGDTMLGECCRHRGKLQISLGDRRHFVAINADEDGRESRAKRRGRSDPPLGMQ